MYVYIHTYMHTYIRMYIHTYIHTYIHIGESDASADPYTAAVGPWGNGQNILKSPLIVTLYRKYARALIFRNLFYFVR